MNSKGCLARRCVGLALIWLVSGLSAFSASASKQPFSLSGSLKGPARKARIVVAAFPNPAPDIDKVLATASAGGSSRFHLQIPRPDAPFIVVAAAPDYIELRGPFHAAGKKSLHLELGSHKAVYRARLTDEQGNPLAGASVTLNAVRGIGLPRPVADALRTKTGLDGAFRLPYPANDAWVLSVAHPDYPRWVALGDPSEAELRLPAPEMLQGLLLDPQGAPIEGGKVRLFRWAFDDSWISTARSDASGAFAIPVWRFEAKPDAIQLQVEAEGFALLRRVASQRELKTPSLTVSMELANSLQGEAGPANTEEEVLVRLFKKRQPQADAGEERVASQVTAGPFSFEQLPAGTYNLEIRSKSFGAKFFGPFELGSGAALDVGKLDPSGSSTIQGFVQDESGQPVSGARLRLLAHPHGTTPARWLPETRSGADGKYLFRKIPQGKLEVEAFKPGYAWGFASVTALPGQTAPVDVTLGRSAGTIEGTFPSGPDSLVRLAFFRSSQGSLYCTPQGIEGWCRWEGLPDGHYLLESLDRLPSPPQSVFLTPDNRHVRLDASASEQIPVRGRLLIGSRPASNVGVSFMPDSPNRLPTQIVSTRPDGSFESAIDQPGTYFVRLHFDSFDFTAQQVELDGSGAPLQISLPGTRFSASIQDSRSGTPVARARFTLTEQAPEGVKGLYVRGSADEQGQIEVTGIPAGRYELECYSERYLAAPGTLIEVGEGFSDPLQLSMDPGRTISGRVTAQDGRPMHDLRILALYDGGDSSGLSDRSGLFEMNGLYSGTMALLIHNEQGGVIVDIPASQADQSLDLQMRGLGSAYLPGLAARTDRVRLLTMGGVDLTPHYSNSIVREGSKGGIRLTGVPAGQYLLRVGEGASAKDFPVTVQAASSKGGDRLNR